VSRRHRSEPPLDFKFPEQLRKWLAEHDDLIEALVCLRRSGACAEAAVTAVLDLTAVQALRLSYELWIALCEGDGVDPDPLLARSLPTSVLDRLSQALWGSRLEFEQDARPALELVRNL
jgi:hypothetical protein